MSRSKWQRSRHFIFFIAGVLLVVLFSACNGQWFKQEVRVLPEVAAIPVPALPDWIEDISPTQDSTPLSPIRIRFKDPLIPLEQIDSPRQQEILENFALYPAIPGKFRFLTPRMVGFQLDQALPQATRLRVTLKAGLSDLQQHRLEEDLAWTFSTAPLSLTDLPGEAAKAEQEADPLDLKPQLSFSANTQLNPRSLKNHVRLEPSGGQRAIPLQIELKHQSQTADLSDSGLDPGSAFNPDQTQWRYTLTPKQPLKKATVYELKFTPGLAPLRGNLPMSDEILRTLKTYAPLAFVKLDYWGQPEGGSAYGRFQKGAAQLQFNQGLKAESAQNHIHLSPAPRAGVPVVRAYEGDRGVDLNPWALEPATTYKIQIDAALEDVYGQTLGRSRTLEYNTGDAAAALWVPSGLNIFPAGSDLQLNISAINLPQASYESAYRVVQPTDLIYTDTAYPSNREIDLLPPAETWETTPLQSPKNQTVILSVPLAEKLGGQSGMLAYGIQARTLRDQKAQGGNEPTYYGMVQLTNLGVFAQWFPQSGMVRVHHLRDGSAAGNVAVEIYQSRLEESPTPGKNRPCAQGKTDAQGLLSLNAAALQACMGSANNEFSEAPTLLVVAREQQDWAFVRTWSYSGYGYGANIGWSGSQPDSRGLIFSDRQIYQPGEQGWFTGEAYQLASGKLEQIRQQPFRVTLVDPTGEIQSLGTQQSNDFGSFSFPIQFSKTQPLGNYTLKAKADNGLELLGEFRIAEFKPPNFKVDLKLDRKFATPKTSVKATANSRYLFGSPLGEAQIRYYVTRQPTTFTPPGWEKFSFGRRWFWPEEEPTVTSDVIQHSGQLDPVGESQQVLELPEDLPFSMTYRWDAEVQDVSNLTVAATAQFVALPSDRLIGLRSDWVADAGKPLAVEMIVTDPTGQPMTGQSVQIELQKMTYHTVTQLLEGSASSQDQVDYQTVDQVLVRSGRSPKVIQLKPPESGAYRIRANRMGAKSEATATDVQLWATGATPVYWGHRYSDDRLELKLDRDQYRPGDRAKVLIQSPYPEAELYLAVVQHQTLYQRVQVVQGGAPEVEIPITAEMLPNAVVEAILIRRGLPLSQTEPDKVEDLLRVGFAPFNLDLSAQRLQITLKPQITSLAPQAEQRVQLTLQDASGQPVRGQFTVMVVNEAVLQLTGYRIPNLLETVYAQQDLSTRFADNRRDVVLAPLNSPLEKGWGFGGGFSAGAGSTRIREDFRALAYFNGSVVTNRQGEAEIQFKLPDDLTTWRIMAVASDENLRFGTADTTFVSTQPLITTPVLPLFARPGDRFEAGVSVTQTTQDSGPLKISGTLAQGLSFADQQQTQQLQPQMTGQTAAFRLPMVATQPGTAQVQFTSQLGQNGDAFQVPLEIRPHSTPEQVISTGTTQDKVEIPLQLSPDLDPTAGGLDVSLSSTLIAELTAPVEQIQRDRDLPFLEPAASQLAIAANLHRLAQVYGQIFPNYSPQRQAEIALDRLARLQNSDGGFAAWPGQKQSDPILTPYAARSLAQAQAAGFTVEERMLRAVKTYLSQRIAEPDAGTDCTSDLCKNQIRLAALMSLAELGDRRNSFVSEIYRLRDDYSLVTQIQLAQYLSRLPDWQAEATALTAKLQAQLAVRGRSTQVDLPRQWAWCYAPELAQAEALQLMILQRQPPESLDRLLQGLLDQRRDGIWGSTYANARALAALVDYSLLQPAPPSFKALARLDGQPLLTHQFEGYRNPLQLKSVSLDQITPGPHRLELSKSGVGQLHYLAALRYRLQGKLAGQMNGLRILRTLRPANQDQILSTMDLRPTEDPLSVSVGQVFDIGLEIITDHPVDHLLVTDPLPAGFEAVDTTFQTATQYFQGRGDSWQLSYQNIFKDQVVAYGDRLEAGSYQMHYLVRSVTPGTFAWPGAEVQLKYKPEEFGRSAAAQLVVQ
ncbi:alpha-2-macroglobulin family protein [Lyngbya confervoides]|uniref:MG2 domain-containing protein n=1 Tax=Lyngbya confervoides BDU141951 TaxID=1574623 RepID=A0ABD4T4J5_9CYAN|nr:Ig-like domain-containing protein [Lyngbya confervoides]MCM1983510.1 MG2 domain-containing protein [Lyngbya confervoides BDU141951]